MSEHPLGAQTGIVPEMVGSATISPQGAFVAGSFQSFTLTYTAGFYGIDDSGSLKIVMRYASDQGTPQFTDPAGANYVTVTASNDAVLEVRYDPKGNVRPWDKCIYIKVVRGYLTEGDSITLVFGDRSQGSPGMRIQTFCEESFEFRVLVDAIATYTYVPIAQQPCIAIVPGPVEKWRVVAPTLVRPGTPFSVRIKGEDRWGNPSNQLKGPLTLVAEGEAAGLPAAIMPAEGDFHASVDAVALDAPGTSRFRLLSEDGSQLACSNPVRVVPVEIEGNGAYWGDLHGQSEETIGSNSARDYFTFARDRAFLDASAHQGNDFQITDAFWDELGALTEEFNDEGSFVTLPGYEWSGNTSLGGDRNVFFTSEGRPIYRSSKALVPDTKYESEICPTANDLFDALTRSREDVICFAHCGGRYADIGRAHDSRIETSIEIHSSWGTFEWLLHDALRLGYRVGIVANSDGHKGRPGASYPGPSTFGAVGGLTCLRMPELSRAALVGCLRSRHHFATTGNRMFMEVSLAFDDQGTIYRDDPAIFDSPGTRSMRATMGDIVHLPQGNAGLTVKVLGTAQILRVDVFNGLELVGTYRPYEPSQMGRTIRVVWQGAEYRGRFRAVTWDGKAALTGNRIESFQAINFLNPDKRVAKTSDGGLEWRSVTTGNLSGLQLVLAEPDSGKLRLTTAAADLEVDIRDIGYEELAVEAGGLEKRLSVMRLPDHLDRLDFECFQPVNIDKPGDNAIYVRVTDMEGNQAWSSPIYLFR
ncbi:MAG: DUF3604 domain-containing protein [Nitratireductor sp.]|nr:DUF3604 domain-containing protein [Nitratireductor sp.]